MYYVLTPFALISTFKITRAPGLQTNPQTLILNKGVLLLNDLKNKSSSVSTNPCLETEVIDPILKIMKEAEQVTGMVSAKPAPKKKQNVTELVQRSKSKRVSRY